MAEKNEETPQVDRPEAGPPDQNAGPDAPRSNPSEEVEQAAAPEAEAPETTEAAPEEAPAGEAPKPKAAPKSGPTRGETLEAKRAERRAAAGKRKPRTPEER